MLVTAWNTRYKYLAINISLDDIRLYNDVAPTWYVDSIDLFMVKNAVVACPELAAVEVLGQQNEKEDLDDFSHRVLISLVQFHAK